MSIETFFVPQNIEICLHTFHSFHLPRSYLHYQYKSTFVSGVTEGVDWVRLHRSKEKSLPFLKEHEDKIILLGLPHFVEKCYCVLILFPNKE